MRSGVAVLVAVAALLALPTASGSPSQRLVPTAVAFSDQLHGKLGLASPHCSGCKPSGAIAETADGGKTWHVIRHTKRRVVALASLHDAYSFGFEGTRSFDGYCPKHWSSGYSADIVDTNITTPWSICVLQPGAGNQEKAVYRGKQRVAFTPMTGGKPYGGISSYGYPLGISGLGSFGIIWESRGTLYVSHDGGREWHPLPHVSRPEIDFGSWASVLDDHTGFALIYDPQPNGLGHSRLIETTDAGRTWRVVHRWD
jgi:hypothetical protein